MSEDIVFKKISRMVALVKIDEGLTNDLYCVIEYIEPAPQNIRGYQVRSYGETDPIKYKKKRFGQFNPMKISLDEGRRYFSHEWYQKEQRKQRRRKPPTIRG